MQGLCWLWASSVPDSVLLHAGLVLALGVIFFISAVNDEVAHRKKPEDSKIPLFTYVYGWAFFCAGSSFITSMTCAVVNVTIYLKRLATNINLQVNFHPNAMNRYHLEMLYNTHQHLIITYKTYTCKAVV